MIAMGFREQGPVEDLRLERLDLPDPEPAVGEVRLRVHVCAVCRTDLHVIEGDLHARRLPLIPGHQIVGTVDKLGPGCSRFREGDRIGVAWLHETCGHCEHCRAGSENLCEASRYTGYHVDGGYADKALVPEAFAYPIPAGLADEQAAPLLCAGIIGYRALRRSALPAGGRLGLYGFGSSAHVVMQLARYRGHDVYVATRGESHRALARRMGATWVGGTLDPPPLPLHSAIVFAPAGEIVPAALRAVGKGGTVALAGIHMSPIPEMDYETCLFHEKNLRSVEANTRVDGEELMRAASDAGVRARVTTFSLEEANDVLLRLKQDRIDGTAVLKMPGR